jgi:hypothetical protein
VQCDAIIKTLALPSTAVPGSAPPAAKHGTRKERIKITAQLFNRKTTGRRLPLFRMIMLNPSSGHSVKSAGANKRWCIYLLNFRVSLVKDRYVRTSDLSLYVAQFILIEGFTSK